MVVNRLRLFVVALALGALATNASGASLEAHLAHTVVREGEPVQLLLRATADDARGAPDLSPLEEEFEVLGTQQSHRLSIVNGRRTSSVDWTVTLLPRRSGSMVIPALRIGAAVSEPLRLEVTDVPAPPTRADAPDLFVESSIDQMSPYVQGEVRYTARVFDAIGLRSGALTEPRVADALIEPAGEGRTYDEVVHGRRYRVHEREYVITPQSSGTLRIPPLVLEARVAAPRGARRSPFEEFFGAGDPFAGMFAGAGFDDSLFDRMMNPGREVRVRSNPIEIEVRARPDAVAEGWFLPARRVELVETFAPVSPEFRVGEAVERTVYLRALGASAAQLPAFEIPSAPGVRQYDEGSRDASSATPEGTVSIREQTVALVPTRPGEVTLPAVEVEWWDTETETRQSARLPARTIEVLPAVGAPSGAATVAVTPPPVSAATQSPPPASNDDVEGGRQVPVAAPSQEILLALAGLLLLALVAGAARVYRRRGPVAEAPGSSPVTDGRVSLRAVHRACRANDAAAVRDALIGWAQSRWGVAAPANPRSIARRLSHAGFEGEAARLDRTLYAPGAEAFDGAAFWRELRAAVRSGDPRGEAANQAVLPELYPSV